MFSRILAGIGCTLRIYGPSGGVLLLAENEDGLGLGHRLTKTHTLPQMGAAQLLYDSLSFRDIPPCDGEPMSGQRFMEVVLS